MLHITSKAHHSILFSQNSEESSTITTDKQPTTISHTSSSSSTSSVTVTTPNVKRTSRPATSNVESKTTGGADMNMCPTTPPMESTTVEAESSSIGWVVGFVVSCIGTVAFITWEVVKLLMKRRRRQYMRRNVSPATTKPVGGNDVLFQEISLKDSTGKATVAVWDSMVDTIQKGKVINISKCRVRLFNAEKKLSTTKASVLEVVAESELQELPISSDDDDDADRTDEAAPSHMPVGSVIAVFEVDPYLACPINSFSNKKLVPVLQNQLYVMRCSKCNGTFRASTAKTYLRVVVLLNTENGNKKCAMFHPTIKQVFQSRGIEFQLDFDKTIIMEAIMKIVPFEIRYTLRGTTIVNILMKRK
ncbi:Hypothetical predicted protein [Mytilus galloprovincialis]|uniref:Uncharacterized protein n=1 Tax=Mytilus galloprovincialis TaxID=29158 RepID=A0A8B6F236_MYTGA|nr:Hypothetical predicted protein [Mytilus galloprovincialis]